MVDEVILAAGNAEPIFVDLSILDSAPETRGTREPATTEEALQLAIQHCRRESKLVSHKTSGIDLAAMVVESEVLTSLCRQISLHELENPVNRSTRGKGHGEDLLSGGLADDHSHAASRRVLTSECNRDSETRQIQASNKYGASRSSRGPSLDAVLQDAWLSWQDGFGGVGQ